MTNHGETLHEALASLGLRSAKDERSQFDTRSIYRGDEFLGHFDASAGWQLVSKLRTQAEVA